MKEKQRIGILTFHNSYNCGSMLQTYALQKKLKKMNLDSEIIDFANDGQRRVYSIFSQEKNLKSKVKNFIIFFHKKQIEKNNLSYELFKKENFILSKNTYSECEELDDTAYKIIITGSDQVWNITIEDGDDAYFLPWVKKAKKVAYAPSFGAKNIMINTNELEKYRVMLKDFSNLSIREQNGKKWIKELIEREIPVLLDPTLLLSSDDYEEILDHNIRLPEKYIFYYSPGFNKNINKLVKKISKKYNLPVICFNAKNFYIKMMNFSSFQLPHLENPSIYLTLIKNASLVITTSFHGTIFSTIFKKNFWTIKNGEMFRDDDRVKTLMQTLSLEDRLISIEFDQEFDYLQTKNYDTFNEKLEKEKIVSIRYLEDCTK